MTYNWWETAKEVMRGTFMTLNVYIRKEENQKPIIYAPTSIIQKWNKIPIVNRSKEIMKVRVETNEIKKQTVEKINKTKTRFSENTNKFDKTLPRLKK